MAALKNFLGLVLLGVAAVVGFYLVSVAQPFEFMKGYVTDEWFLKLGEYVTEWGTTALIVLGLSRMLAINNNLAICITLVLYLVLSVVVVMTFHYPQDLAEILSKLGIK